MIPCTSLESIKRITEVVTVVTVTEVTVFSGGGTRDFGVLTDCK